MIKQYQCNRIIKIKFVIKYYLYEKQNYLMPITIPVQITVQYIINKTKIDLFVLI